VQENIFVMPLTETSCMELSRKKKSGRSGTQKIFSSRSIKLKRVYETPIKADGFRILVDRLWPRGIAKEKARVDLWLKDIAPSTELRTWFGHDPAKWKDFQKRYKKELMQNNTVLENLRRIIKEQNKVTLVFAASDENHNNAVVLRTFLASGE
jgi:uncharacterized protein YeaO (DUF488 family)